MPTVIFLGGLKSDMQGTKALMLHNYCESLNISFLRFDYTGHGESSGVFTDGTIGIWKEDVLTMIDHITQGDLILIGSSLGGWLMVLAALARKERVKGLIGVASAPDFTENLMWAQMDEPARATLVQTGIYQMPSEYSECPYPITHTLIEDGRNHLVLNTSIPLECPVQLLHGTKDDDVPYTLSISLSEAIASDDVSVTLIKGGDHRMSNEVALEALKAMVKKATGV